MSASYTRDGTVFFRGILLRRSFNATKRNSDKTKLNVHIWIVLVPWRGSFLCVQKQVLSEFTLRPNQNKQHCFNESSLLHLLRWRFCVFRIVGGQGWYAEVRNLQKKRCVALVSESSLEHWEFETFTSCTCCHEIHLLHWTLDVSSFSKAWHSPDSSVATN